MFLGWNMTVSNVAPLVWGVLQLRNAAASAPGKRWEGWPMVLVKVGAVTAVGGPGAGVAWCLWSRDEIVLKVDGEGEGKKLK